MLHHPSTRPAISQFSSNKQILLSDEHQGAEELEITMDGVLVGLLTDSC